jgi:UDP-N-acetylmuramoylalanine--D-glutamate ligase
MGVKNKLKFFQNKKIAMHGLGVDNLALIKFILKNRIDCRLTVCDPKSAAELSDRFLEIKELARKNKLPEINLMSGINYDAHLTDFDIVFRSPGSLLLNPNIVKAKKAGVKISSAMELFFQLCPTKNIIGVTGSKGKGTTASLIYEIIKASLKKITHPVSRGAIHSTRFRDLRPSQEGNSQRVFLGGNIGTAPFEFIEKIKPNDFVVLELSSFQLEDLKISPRVAVITNIFKEHLAPADPNNPNYHKSMKDYWAAKANIFTHQKKSDWLVIHEKLKSTVIPAQAGIQNGTVNAVKLDSRLRGNDGAGKMVVYGKSELPSNLTGEHNKENVAAAAAVAKIFKIKKEVIAEAVKKFQGLPHRLEFVAEINGVKYFDDSFATVPDVSVIALKAIGGVNEASRLAQPTSFGFAQDRPSSRVEERNIILLAGGADKGSDFKNFAKEIKKRVKFLILFKGKGSERLKKELQNTKYPFDSAQGRKIQNTKEVDNMKDAVKIAKSKAGPGDIVLLSTGCASFGCFKNYKERSDLFKSEVAGK